MKTIERSIVKGSDNPYAPHNVHRAVVYDEHGFIEYVCESLDPKVLYKTLKMAGYADLLTKVSKS